MTSGFEKAIDKHIKNNAEDKQQSFEDRSRLLAESTPDTITHITWAYERFVKIGLDADKSLAEKDKELSVIKSKASHLESVVKDVQYRLSEKDKRIAELEEEANQFSIEALIEDARIKQERLDSIKKRYEIDLKWRSAWISLANKREPGRLQLRQDRIEIRAAIANRRIGTLLKSYHETPGQMK